MANNFIENRQILEEDYRVDDLLDFSYIVSDFKKTLEKIDRNSIIGLVGKFGSGKSTMLYQLYKEQQGDGSEKWLVFDAWKYPERKDLWEGFVLDMARQLDKKLFNQARKKIDGSLYGGIKNLINILFEGTNFFIPGSGIGKNFTNLFKSSPARRVFEFQEILSEIIKKANRNIYIIIEDIDRSGDNGIFFLETLRNFIKENKFDKKIIAIVPIGNEYFDGGGKQAYLKTVDYRINFNPSKIGFVRFIEKVFRADLVSEHYFKSQINYLFRLLLKEKELTIREIKHILRLAELRFQKLSGTEQPKIDMRIFILFEAINYIKEQILHLINDKQRIKNDFWGMNFLLMIANSVDEEGFKRGGFKTNLPFFLTEDDLYTPKFNKDIFEEENNGYYMTNNYLKIFE